MLCRELWCSLPLIIVLSTQATAQVAILANPTYVDYTVGDVTSEAWNLEDFITNNLKLKVKPFKSILARDLATLFSSNQVVIIPELENADLLTDLDADAKEEFRTFLFYGGTLIVMGEYYGADIKFINGIVGTSLTKFTFLGNVKKTADADTGIFESLPNMLQANNGTYGIDLKSVPKASEWKNFYASDTGVGIASFEHDFGRLFFYAYDFYNYKNSTDPKWVDALRLIIQSAL